MNNRNINTVSRLGKHRGKTMLCMILLLLITISLFSGCIQTKNTSAEQDESEQIKNLAWETINRDIANYESNPEVKIKDSKITRLEKIESFDALTDKSINVYALEYRLLPEDLSKVVLAGGMQTDEEGWLKETCSMGSPLLVITSNNGKVELLGTLWTGGVLEEGGLEQSVKDLLERN